MDALIAAVRNNAQWCDAVVRAQGGATRWSKGLWQSLSPPPRFYPDAITLTADATLGDVARVHPGRYRSVKDSFATLDLSSLGLKILFDAQWIHRAAGRAISATPVDGVTWRAVRDSADLAKWERSFRGNEDERVFAPELLRSSEICFIGGWREADCVAGAVCNRHAGVCAISNVFTPDDSRADYLADLVARAADWAGTDALVGYETDVTAWLALGFAALGRLRIWQQPP